jgi:hypothetical protein
MLSPIAIALVVCAPGYPGSTAEAQPAMDALAKELSAHLPEITAAYYETEQGGLSALRKPDAALVLATLPFFLEHEKDLHLTAKLMAVPQGGQPLEKWTLVTGKDHPSPLAGYAVQSQAGGSPRFVRAMAPQLPPGAQVSPSGAVLSGLRKAANGEKIALLLDGAEAASLATLPFAAQLAAVSTSPAVPVAVVATVGKRLGAERWKPLESAFTGMSGGSAQEALSGIRISGFAPLDEGALDAARAAYRKAK